MKSDANEIATKLECGRSSRHNGGCGGSVGCGGCGLGGPMRYRALVGFLAISQYTSLRFDESGLSGKGN